jgi:hypothetical protein
MILLLCNLRCIMTETCKENDILFNEILKGQRMIERISGRVTFACSFCIKTHTQVTTIYLALIHYLKDKTRRSSLGSSSTHSSSLFIPTSQFCGRPCPCLWQTREPTSAWAAPMCEADSKATWCLDLHRDSRGVMTA